MATLKHLEVALPSTLPLPFSCFQDVQEMRDQGLDASDLHAGSTPGASPYLRHWLMGEPAVLCTTIWEIREWISRRRAKDGVSAWARRMAAAPLEVQEIERWLT